MGGINMKVQDFALDYMNLKDKKENMEECIDILEEKKDEFLTDAAINAIKEGVQKVEDKLNYYDNLTVQ